VSLDREVLSGSTFVMRAVGDGLVEFGIHDGDRLVVDRGVDAALGQVVVVEAAGERVAGLYRQTLGRRMLTIGAVDWPLTDEALVWGVVTHCVHRLTRAFAGEAAANAPRIVSARRFPGRK
jgi:DNA polymerase V